MNMKENVQEQLGNSGRMNDSSHSQNDHILIQLDMIPALTI